MSQKDVISCDFVCEWFDFLRTWISSESDNHDENRTTEGKCLPGYENINDSEEEDINAQPKTNVTCCNCDENFLFFGTSTGWIYCFSRGGRQAKGPLYEHHPVNCQIIGIQIPDENVVSLLLPHGFILFNFVQNEIIYSWSLQRFDCQHPQSPDNCPSMITSKCIYDESRHRYNVFTGDSVGTVRCHNVIEDETVTIFSEENNQCIENVNRDDNSDSSQSTHYHQIVQIDVYSPDLLVVSTCFRSVILWKSISDSWTAIQVGLNVRKVCGQYGAIFHREGNTILASRPSMHLIKANTTDGSVVETFKLKSAKPVKNLNLFREVNKPGERKSTSAVPINLQNTPNVFSLGFLLPLQINNEDYICSWNSHSLLIIKLDGTLLVKEYSSIKIITVNVSYCKGFRDVIILREDWTIFRIRFIVKNYKARTSDYGIGEVLKGTLGNQNLLNLPSQAFNSLEGEIKKIYTIMQDKIYEGGEKLLTYTSFDSLNVLRRNSSMDNQLNQKNDTSESPSLDQTTDCDNDEILSVPTSPLYIHQRILRKNSANSKSVTDSEKSEEDVLFTVSQTRLSNSFDVDPTRSNLSNSNSIEDSQHDKNDRTYSDSDVDIADVNENIENMEPQECSADNACIKDQAPTQSNNSINLDGLELVKKFHEYSSSNYASDVKSTMIRDGVNIFKNIEILDKDQTPDYIPSIIEERLQLSTASRSKSRCSSIDDRVRSYEYTEESTPIEPDEIVCIPVQEQRPVKYVEWQLAIESTHNSGQLVIKYFCASAYSDLESNSYVWLFCVSKNRSKLVYYPDFESLRLPPGNNKRFIMGAIKNRIYIFNEDNELWTREGVDESGLAIVPLGSLGTKWTNVVLPKLPSIRFTNLSLCSTDFIGWLSDENGDVWLTKLETNSWTKISHDPDNKFHVKEVQVCPVDSSLVWCIDSLNRLFVRAGIFNTRGDEDEHIGGMAWLPVHAPVEVKSLAVSSKSVWILSKQGNRLFKRIGIQPPSSYVGTDWQEIKAPTLLKDSLKAISASLNGDIWLLTELGSIWQVCDL